MKDYAESFYLSKSWRSTRNAYYKSKCGLCERCGRAGDIVHHKKYITPKNIRDPQVTLNWANLELLCQDCHNKQHTSKSNKRYLVDKNGNILPPTQLEITTAAGTGNGRTFLLRRRAHDGCRGGVVPKK